MREVDCLSWILPNTLGTPDLSLSIQLPPPEVRYQSADGRLEGTDVWFEDCADWFDANVFQTNDGTLKPVTARLSDAPWIIEWNWPPGQRLEAHPYVPAVTHMLQSRKHVPGPEKRLGMFSCATPRLESGLCRAKLWSLSPLNTMRMEGPNE